MKKNSKINSKNTLDLKQGNQTLITKNNKNNKKTEVTTKITTKDIKQEDISVENSDLDGNGVPKNQMNSTNSSLFDHLDYFKLSIEALQRQNEQMETMNHRNSFLLEYLDEEQSVINENCNFLEDLIEMNKLLNKSEITKLDEQIKILNDEIGNIDELTETEEITNLIEMEKELEEMVVNNEHLKVNYFNNLLEK